MEHLIIRGFSTTQPFYLPRHKRLPWMNNRAYLPALEEPKELKGIMIKVERPEKTQIELQKLKAYYIHLDKKLRTHIQASISKRKYKYD